jgi:hypothetical protein
MEPPPVETDIPEDFFTDRDLVLPLVITWKANWQLAHLAAADGAKPVSGDAIAMYSRSVPEPITA